MKVINGKTNCAIDFKPVFEQLNNELVRIGRTLDLICAGGYVMQLHGYRATADVDAFYKSDAELDVLIKKVGDNFRINKPDELWLNNSIANMNPEPPEEYIKTVYKFSNLTVYAVEIIYLIGMKLVSIREQDLKDVGTILKNDSNEQPFDLLSKLVGMGFSIDISSVLDAYESAYGILWLDEFYSNNQDEMRNYF